LKNIFQVSLNGVIQEIKMKKGDEGRGCSVFKG
jgi:hypothetical protein